MTGLEWRLPRIGRVVRDPLTVYAWIAAAVFAWVMFATLKAEARPTPFAAPPALPWTLSPVDRLDVCVVAALPITFCRRRPVLALAAMLAESLAGAVFGLRPSVLLLGIAGLVCVVSASRPRPIGLAAAVTALTAWMLQDWLAAGRLMAGGKTGDIILVMVVAFIGGVLVRERHEHTRALREQTAARAVTAERLRIARELHDMVAHSIGIVAIQAGAAKRVIETRPDRAKDALDAIETTSRETLAGLRHMLGALRQAESERAGSEREGTAPSPGLADLDRVVEGAANAGVRVDVRWHGERRHLPRELDLSAFRIIQESVTNVVRHAGTHHCRVGVEFGRDELAIEIVDDGRGAAAGTWHTAGTRHAAGHGGGYGLTGMRERVSLLDGRFAAGPRPEGGFRVEARLPA